MGKVSFFFPFRVIFNASNLTIVPISQTLLSNLNLFLHYPVFRWLPMDVARIFGRRSLEPLLSPNSHSIVPIFQPSSYLALPLMSILNIARLVLNNPQLVFFCWK